MDNISRELYEVIELAIDQGRFAQSLRDIGKLEINVKRDGSLVTNADIAISEVALSNLRHIVDLPVLSEEHRLNDDIDSFWIIDPIDGTSAFTQGYDSWAISIALIMMNRPVMGVIVVPDRNALYFAEKSKGAFFMDLKADKSYTLRVSSIPPYSVATHLNQGNYQRNKLNKRLLDLGINVETFVGEPALLKFLGVAKGDYTFGGGFELLDYWDIAAADLIVHEAGGFFCNLNDLTLFRYETRDTLAVAAFASSKVLHASQWS